MLRYLLPILLLTGCGPSKDAIYEDMKNGDRVKVEYVGPSHLAVRIFEGINERLLDVGGSGELYAVVDLTSDSTAESIAYTPADALPLRRTRLIVDEVDDFRKTHKCVHGCALLEKF